jgi:hypothetical protein
VTDIESTATPPVPITDQAPKSGMQRMIGALFSPDDTFRDIARKPDFLVPLVVLLVITTISSLVIVPHLDMASAIRDQLANSGKNLSPDDIDRSVRLMSSFSKVVAYATPLIGPAMWALVAGVLLLTFRLFGAEGTYKPSFAVTLYAWIPLVLNSIITTVVAVFRGTVDPREMATVVVSNPGVLVNFKDHPLAFSFLSSVDLFTIWTLILLTIGFAYVSGTSKARSAVTVFGWWAFLVLMKLGFAAMGAAKMQAAS